MLLNKIAVTLKVSIGQMLSGNIEDISLSSNALSSNEGQDMRKLTEPYYIEYSEEKDLGLVSPYLYGNNLEHTRSSVCNGLSAQMLQNRKFVGKPSAMEGVASGWFAIGKQTFCAFGAPYTRHNTEHYHMHRALECNSQEILCCENGVESGMGQHGLCIEAHKSYDFAIVAKCVEDVTVTVRLTDHKGEHLYASCDVKIAGGTEWNRYQILLTPNADDADADLRIVFHQQACVCIGCISLMDHDNFHGMRKDVIETMKQIGITVLRWPGGNFAGEYNWFDGLLPVDERAPFESYLRLETQPHTFGYDFHEINTDDFIALCREIGAEPYITVNIAWNTPEENAAWVEYCNGDSTTKYGKLRAERGHTEPYNVLLWSLGNEMGYGHMEGDNTASGYSHLARKNGNQMLTVCRNLTLCSSGPYPNEEWVTYSAKPLSDIAPLVSAHHYGPRPAYNDIAKLPSEYKKCLSGVTETRNRIRRLRAMLGNNQIISFDEWNAWYGWYRPSCVIDGMYAAMMMHMFIDEARKSDIGIVCHFEAVNESAIKVTPNAALLTATGAMLKLMKLHSNARLLFADDFAVVTEKDRTVTMTLINFSHENEQKFCGKIKGACIKACAYVGNNLMPNSNFDEQPLSVVRNGDSFETTLKPLSVALIQFIQQ